MVSVDTTSIGRHTYAYNGNLLLTHTYSKYNFSMMKDILYVREDFNEFEDIISKTIVQNKVSTTRLYTYTYDNQKNWVSQMEIENGKPEALIERIYEYL